MSVLPLASPATPVPLAQPLNGSSFVEYANLDYAASAPALAAVADAVARALPLYASVHRGAGYLSQVSTALYEQARTAIANFVDARAHDVTVITRNTTDSFNLLAGCVPTGARVLVLDTEHHANMLPWQRHIADVLKARETVAETLSVLASALATRNYRLVTVSAASNVTGEALPLAEVIRLAHTCGARVAIDAAQLLPHRQLSLRELDADYVAFSGHKLYAPYGAGALVGRRDWLDAGTPYLAGGGAVENVTVRSTTWEPAPARHEAGSPNVLGAIALGVACSELAKVQDELAQHDASLRSRLISGLAAIDGVEVLRLWQDSTDPIAVATFTVAGHDPGFVAAVLSAEYGIGLRDGRFCAHPLLAGRGIGAALRASIGLGTTAEHIDRLLQALSSYIHHGARGEYEVVEGRWQSAQSLAELPQALGLLADLGAEENSTSIRATAAAGGSCTPVESPALPQ